ncbi:AAA family ATPase [Erwinia rhapontici]|uniref:AAA family ATPase n=1 Tax=Erwinia rhapontici TaxID=55212 RepID=UPI0014385C79|nr:AAA family ATPase [Erwinia rhapontici]
MQLISLRIEKLFDNFDYLIPLDNRKVSFLTGPNGYGKTIILNIIKSISKGELYLFKNLPFKNIKLSTTSGFVELIKTRSSIKVILNKNEEVREKLISLIVDGFEGDDGLFSGENEVIDDGISSVTGHGPDSDRFIKIFYNLNKSISDKKKKSESNFNVKFLKSNFPDDFIFFIKAERLDNLGGNVSIIDNRAEMLRELINEVNDQSAAISQKLDSTFPSRLFSSLKKSKSPNRSFLRERLFTLQERRKLYMASGLIESEDVISADYDNETLDSSEFYTVLDLHISDAFQKLEPLENLYTKIKLFESSIKDKVMANKSVIISKEKGFYFNGVNNNVIDRNVLSSGEQNQIVILFDLIFNANKHKLILIDEPENSLHIAWQQDFLTSINKIIALNDFSQVIIATHSTSIIDHDWESVTDLYKLSQGR